MQIVTNGRNNNGRCRRSPTFSCAQRTVRTSERTNERTCGNVSSLNVSLMSGVRLESYVLCYGFRLVLFLFVIPTETQHCLFV